MALSTAISKNNGASGVIAPMAYLALFTTVPAGAAGTEVTGGTPAYARRAITWSAPVNGVSTGTIATPFDVPAGVTVRGAGVMSAATGGTYLEGGAVTEQVFATQGTYNLTATFTES
jgi:hypothetical protein